MPTPCSGPPPCCWSPCLASVRKRVTNSTLEWVLSMGERGSSPFSRPDKISTARTATTGCVCGADVACRPV